ncbi:hypothetical protein B0H19DRAFT_1063111 [Mycena capillaripes]|nr:hypothetical protein B0H19DRAFT_1063111 [Mycena capillaripes]
MVVTTHSPPALVALARSSSQILHVFPAAALAVPHPPSSPASDANRASFPPKWLSIPNSSYTYYTPPTPTSALHGRLAFLTPPPAAPSSAPGAAPLASWGRTLGSFFSRSAPATSALAASVFSGAKCIRVVDLAPLLGGGAATKERGGGGVRDVHVFEAGAPTAETLAPAHLYALRRGRTGAVVESVASARDGRFVALVTRRRTVHVFAVNLYGGRADVRNHLGARVRDAEGGASVGVGAGVSVIGIGNGNGEGEGSTEVHALVRMRLPPAPQVSQHQHAEGEASSLPPPAPLAIVFVPAAASALGLRSPTSPVSQASGSSTGAGGSVSGVQDVLVFDPADGVLSLRRITLALEVPRPRCHERVAPRCCGAPQHEREPAAVVFARGGCGCGGREWWGGSAGGVGREGGGGGDVEFEEEAWLAQAELSTFSSAPRVLPRAIYLSHQFAFYTLGEDYHALIRRYQFAIGGAKIDVRREVEGDVRGGPRLFLPARDPAPQPRVVIFRRAIGKCPGCSMPVRAVAGLGDGVAEGLGRLRREMRHQRQKQLARSPPARKGGDDVEASVPLEFDEEDEDSLSNPGMSRHIPG